MADQPGPSPGRRLPKVALALGAAAFATAAALSALWVFRAPLAGWALDQYFEGRSAPAEFEIRDVGFGGITIEALDLGPEARAERAEALIAWGIGGPRLSGIVLHGVEAQGRLDESGLSLGALDRLRPAPNGKPFAIPALTVDLRDVTVQIETPQGLVTADLAAQGRLRGVLSGALTLRFAPTEGAGCAVSAALSGDADTLRAVLSPEADSAIVVSGMVRAPWDLEGIEADVTAETAQFAMSGTEAQGLRAALAYRGGLPEAGSTPFGSLQASVSAARLKAGPFRLRDATVEITAPLTASLIGAPFTLTADQALGLGFGSGAVAVEGAGVWSRDGGLSLEGEAQFAGFGLTAGGRERLNALWLKAQGTPLEPLSAAGVSATLGALSNGALTVPFGLSQDGAGFMARFPGAITLRGGNGVEGAILPREAAVLRLGSLDFAFTGDARLGGAALTGAQANGVLGGAWRANGTLAAQDWRGRGAALRHEAIALTASGGKGEGWRLAAEGRATVSGPLAGGAVEGLQARLRITAAFAPNGAVTVSQAGGCAPLRFARLALPTLALEAGALSFCPEGGVLARIGVNGGLQGGFRVEPVSFSGAQGDLPAAITVDGLEGRWGGTTSAPRLSVALGAASYALALSPERTVTTLADAITAEVALGSLWGAEGTLTGVRIADPAGPVSITGAEGAWAAAPQGDRVRFTLANASARVADQAAEGATPRFNPIVLSEVSGSLLQGSAAATGMVSLASNGRSLGRFDAQHDLATASGSGQFTAADLRFDDGLQPLHLSEFARGAIIWMEGAVSGAVNASWTPEALKASGESQYAIDRIALPAVPDIRGVSGRVVFDDLLAFSTPPGQEVAAGIVNPGVALEDGTVRFQLLPGGRMAVEAAQWDFASGVLTLDPTVITLGQGRSLLMLRLSAVDAGAAVRALQIKDLIIEGEVEGVFPVQLSPSAAVITDGVLQATAPGRLAYVGPAGEGMGGLAQIAFDALRDFRYQTLRATLNGDLAGDIDVDVQMEGLHVGEDLDLSEIIPLAGARATADDVPFHFDISVHAPFRELVNTGAGIGDARRYLPRAIEEATEPEAEPPLDPSGPTPP
jgi:hypothetical protein